MNDNRESGAAAERPIRRLLVRYGRSGNVAWFGTVHDLHAERGDAVVVLTALGQWPGHVLRIDEPSNSLAASSAASPPVLSGELLRPMSESDQERSGEARRRSRELVALARREVSHTGGVPQTGGVSQTGGADSDPDGGSRGAPITVIDAEISLCGRFAVVWFAGRGGAALGPAAVRLADALGLERVQWIAAESPAAASAVSGIEPTTPTPLPPAPEPAPAPEQVGEREQAVDREQDGGVLRTLRALRATDPAALGSLARRERERLGMLGAYSQKIRGEPGAAGGQGGAASRRRWMLRMRATAGGVTIGQLDQLAQLAMRHGDGSLRLTMRQGLQMHGVLPGSAGEVLRAIESLAMTTRGSCGNVVRNVTCCPLPPGSRAALAARQLAATVTQEWLPRAEWLSWIIEAEEGEAEEWGTAAGGDAGESDAAYREGYLPHKWKVGVATAEDNCVNVLTNDLGLVVHCEGTSGPVFVDCYVGGSLAYRPGVTGSAAMLAEPLGGIFLADVGDLLAGLTRVHRQISTAGPRHWRRLKYLVRRIGCGALAERIEHEVGREGLFSPIDRERLPAWTGHPPWTLRTDGGWTRTVEVLGGRLRFGDNQPGEAWLRLCRYGRAMRIGPRHSLVIDGINGNDKPAVDSLIAGPLAEFAAKPVGAGSHLGVDAGDGAQQGVPRVVACVALPTCPLAVAEAERTAAEWRRALEPVVSDAAIFISRESLVSHEDRQPITVAVSGCSNGCSHPLTSTIGIVAEGPRQFRIFVGGDGRSLGTSLGTVEGPSELARLVRMVAKRFRAEGEGCESFADWWNRRRN